jgi:hypothetical protein
MAMKTSNLAVVGSAKDIVTEEEESNCEWRKFH